MKEYYDKHLGYCDICLNLCRKSDLELIEIKDEEIPISGMVCSKCMDSFNPDLLAELDKEVKDA